MKKTRYTEEQIAVACSCKAVPSSITLRASYWFCTTPTPPYAVTNGENDELVTPR